ncbi:hypothetical protein K435DRAFT_805472 [Dendrothele bispora CBS 962.96]|uniref:Uncharacterized protein n=1 Tax=Dendrothele bispora (strain CBS 962.96) TaxID=1314807 RepID=A0A4S8LAX7_DENBC|nr:hypothetical protein K435DRAFT_805472 [Dendrothele bispora CBS 962.96]
MACKKNLLAYSMSLILILKYSYKEYRSSSTSRPTRITGCLTSLVHSGFEVGASALSPSLVLERWSALVFGDDLAGSNLKELYLLNSSWEIGLDPQYGRRCLTQVRTKFGLKSQNDNAGSDKNLAAGRGSLDEARTKIYLVGAIMPEAVKRSYPSPDMLITETS